MADLDSAKASSDTRLGSPSQQSRLARTALDISQLSISTSLTASVMASPDTQSLGFLDLPRELRNKIYSAYFETKVLRNSHRARIHTALLKVNRQIHVEAYDTMCKELKFIDVVTNVPAELSSLLSFLGVPAICSSLEGGPDKAASFQHFVMQIRVWHATAGNQASHMMIMAGENLEWFCKGISNFNNIPLLEIPRIMKSACKVKLMNPFDDVDYAAVMRSELLAPMQRYWKGFRRFELAGCVQEETRRELQADINKDRWGSWMEALAEFDAANEKGTQVFSTGDNLQALHLWDEAISLCLSAGECDQADDLFQAGGLQWIYGLKNFTFAVHINRAAASFKLAEEADRCGSGRGNSVVAELANLAIDAVDQALDEMTDRMAQTSMWIPSRAFVAKAFYRKAVALKLMGHPEQMRQAENLITTALDMAPNDSSISRAYDDIHLRLN